MHGSNDAPVQMMETGKKEIDGSSPRNDVTDPD